jgi:chitosanase
MISAENKIRILSTLSIFETGTRDGNYGDVTVLKDGEHSVTKERIFQITYGRHQTTEGSFLKELLTNYVANNGQFADDIRPYIPKIGNGALVKDETFLNLLRRAGKEDSVMQETQDVLFDEKYYQPALQFFTINGFTLPLSMLVIYDSQIHSGGKWEAEGGILQSLRKKFPEVPPRKGGSEKAWIKAYVRVRHEWLSNHRDPILRKTNYRTATFLKEIERDDNWDLSKPIKTQGETSRSIPPR